MSSDSLGDDASSWPTRHELASVWEENGSVRNALRQHGKILLWPSVQTTGVGTVAALRLNPTAVADALEIWASHSSTPKSPPIHWLKDEACCMVMGRLPGVTYILEIPFKYV